MNTQINKHKGQQIVNWKFQLINILSLGKHSFSMAEVAKYLKIEELELFNYFKNSNLLSDENSFQNMGYYSDFRNSSFYGTRNKYFNKGCSVGSNGLIKLFEIFNTMESTTKIFEEGSVDYLKSHPSIKIELFSMSEVARILHIDETVFYINNQQFTRGNGKFSRKYLKGTGLFNLENKIELPGALFSGFDSSCYADLEGIAYIKRHFNCSKKRK